MCMCSGQCALNVCFEVLLSTEENNCTTLYVILLFRPSHCMKKKLLTPTLIIATLEQLSSLGEENHETMRSNCAMSSSRLLKKPDQCRSVTTCAHVFWSGHFTNEDREVMEVSQTLCVFIYDVQTLRTQLTNLYCQVVLGNIMNCTTLHFITGQPTHTVQ